MEEKRGNYWEVLTKLYLEGWSIPELSRGFNLPMRQIMEHVEKLRLPLMKIEVEQARKAEVPKIRWYTRLRQWCWNQYLELLSRMPGIDEITEERED